MIDRLIKEFKDGVLIKEYHGDEFSVDAPTAGIGCDRYGQNNEHKTKVLEWMRNYWRPAIAVLYATILFLDFIVRPIVNITYAEEFDLVQTVEAVKELDPMVQVQAIEIASRNELWPQITNQELHYVFLVLLGITAWTRGQEKIASNKNNGS